MRSLRVAVLVALATTLSAAPALAASAPTWNSAKEAALPHGALAIASGYLPSLACSSTGNCAAGGIETLATGLTDGIILNEVRGRWTAPISLVAPPNAAANAALQVAEVSCGANGSCAAIGSYVTMAGVSGFVAREVHGAWRRAQAVALPANALRVGQDAAVRSVSCTANETCSAVGVYLDDAPTPKSQAFVLNEVAGVWRRAREVRLGADVNADPFVVLNQVSCGAAGDCLAVGSYDDRDAVNQALIVREVHGVWHGGATLPLPLNASAYASATMNEVACVGRVACSVVGTYVDQSGAIQAFDDDSLRGSWPRASELLMPAGARANPEVFSFGFRGVDCASAGNCSVGGQYQDTTGAYQGFLANEVSGVWQPATTLSLPSGATSVGKNGGAVAVTCPSVGNCRAGADYLDANGDYEALLDLEVDGVWQRGTRVLLPAGAATVGADGGVYAVVCTTARSCVASGSYQKSAGTFEAFTVST